MLRFHSDRPTARAASSAATNTTGRQNLRGRARVAQSWAPRSDNSVRNALMSAARPSPLGAGKCHHRAAGGRKLMAGIHVRHRYDRRSRLEINHGADFQGARSLETTAAKKPSSRANVAAISSRTKSISHQSLRVMRWTSIVTGRAVHGRPARYVERLFVGIVGPELSHPPYERSQAIRRAALVVDGGGLGCFQAP